MIIIVALILAVITSIFWMVVGWRAMRAHERLADSHEALSRIANAVAVKHAGDVEATAVPVRAQQSPIPPAPPVQTGPDQY